MHFSPAPTLELDKASAAIMVMERATDLDEFEEAWRPYLHHLERCSNKAQSHYKKSPKWGAWWGKYKKLRSDDELLSYLINARGADEHSVDNMLRDQHGESELIQLLETH